ncbi:response regulator transcription factor [Kitasatospora sp. NPDC059646]|uniref:response regulator transcription factor n=1 Tax=Kitasatospora sp. NPDC059646 TaxID=3346893 RepID=UPI00367481D7
MRTSAVPPTAATVEFSRRELQVLHLVGEGASYAVIARRLGLSPHTVDTYLRRIRAKSGVSSQVQLALLASRLPAPSARAAAAA